MTECEGNMEHMKNTAVGFFFSDAREGDEMRRFEGRRHEINRAL
jgi:hypothetical protein